MTGYGRGECARDGFKITVELGAVNRRQSEISVNLPRELELLEAQVRDTINAQVARGRVNGAHRHPCGGRPVVGTRTYQPAARQILRHGTGKAGEVAQACGRSFIGTYHPCAGVFQSDEELVEAESIWPVVEKALKPALAALVKMREREGAHLAEDLTARIGIMRSAVEKIQKQAPQTAENYRQNLLARIKSAGIENIAPDDERLLKEIVLFADRSDISEELTRLQSHFKQFEDCRKSKEPVGRTLDFLAQEMNREINTIGSKANDAIISREVVTLKTELERFREQVQNVE